MPGFQPEQIATSDRSSVDGESQEATLPNIMADDERGVGQTSLPQSITEDSLSQSELSPLAPEFSPSCSALSELLSGSAENQYQRPSRIRNPPIMLNYDWFGSPSNVQHASVQPVQVMSNHPTFNMPTFYPWYYVPVIRNQLYPCHMTVAY